MRRPALLGTHACSVRGVLAVAPPGKTRLIEFGCFAADRRARRGLGKPETFNVLGFTFICERTSQGKFFIMRKTRRDRMRAKVNAVKEELRRRLHERSPSKGLG